MPNELKVKKQVYHIYEDLEKNLIRLITIEVVLLYLLFVVAVLIFVAVQLSSWCKLGLVVVDKRSSNTPWCFLCCCYCCCWCWCCCCCCCCCCVNFFLWLYLLFLITSYVGLCWSWVWGLTISMCKNLLLNLPSKRKITSRTTGAKGNKFLRVITRFNDRKTKSNRYQVTNQN